MESQLIDQLISRFANKYPYKEQPPQTPISQQTPMNPQQSTPMNPQQSTPMIPQQTPMTPQQSPMNPQQSPINPQHTPIPSQQIPMNPHTHHQQMPPQQTSDQQMTSQPPIQNQTPQHEITMDGQQRSSIEDSISQLEKQLNAVEPRKNYFMSMDFFIFVLKLLLVIIIIICCYFLFRKRN